MIRTKIFTFLFGFLFLTAAASFAQLAVIDSEQLKSYLHNGQKVVLVDARPVDEYRQAHIPGAINVQPERMKSAGSRLPKNKTTPIIFYCRGEG
jgi:rhodanese-related sulfurtransferase